MSGVEVDTAELRELLEDALAVANDCCADNLSDRIEQMLSALTRPIPAAPAEPGATEAERRVVVIGSGPGLAAAAQAWSRRQIEKEAAALAAPAPADEGRGATYLHGWGSRRHILDADSAELGYGSRRALCGAAGQMERDRFRDRNLSDRAKAAILCRPVCKTCAAIAASPASAVPEERDEVAAMRKAADRLTAATAAYDEFADPPDRDARAEWHTAIGILRLRVDRFLAARPAPVTAAPTEGEAP